MERLLPLGDVRSSGASGLVVKELANGGLTLIKHQSPKRI